LSKVKFLGKKLASPLTISERGLKDAESAHKNGMRVMIAYSVNSTYSSLFPIATDFISLS
jgi:hypothetical protein